MHWYIAKLVFRISQPGRPQFDEHIRLIAATNFEEAFKKARLIGIGEEDTDHIGPSVRWEFVNVSDLYPIDALKDGVELHSAIREEDEAERYVRSVHLKAMDIELGVYPN